MSDKKLVALTRDEIANLLTDLKDWHFNEQIGEIEKEFTFKSYFQTIAFVNAVAWMAQKEKHHPDLNVSYGRVKVRYSTHDIRGISELDFVSAQKVEDIYQDS